MDETNEHVDNVCAFLKPGEVILAWTDNREDPQYPLSMRVWDIWKERQMQREEKSLCINFRSRITRSA